MKRAWAWPAVLLAGCTASMDPSREPLPVTVSAANYSQGSEEEIYSEVHGATNAHAVAPAIPVPDKPLFYGFVPGDIYSSDVPLDRVYRELAVSLAHRGYFNVVYQAESGHMPRRLDYLLRVHCGVRRWKTPVVRTDRVTWGDDSLVGGRRDSRSQFLHGEASAADPRAGQDSGEAVGVATYLQSLGSGATGSMQVPSFTPSQTGYSVAEVSDPGTQEYCLVVVEAFRWGDLMAMRDKAPCVWATFVAVPLRTGQEFSNLLRTMVKTATPYFGTTTNGIQEFDLPPGKVLMGEPVVVPGPQEQH